MKTRQLGFWTEDFGDAYVERSRLSPQQVIARGEHLDKIFVSAGIERNVSILEVGANIGLNLKGLRKCGWSGSFYAVEPNKKAYDMLKSDREIALNGAFHSDGFDLPVGEKSIDLAFTCGVLIHVHPEDLFRVCSEIYRVSRSYIACMEYFSPEPVEKNYRGHQGLLFKRDFGGFYLDHWSDLKLLDYGFLWKKVTPFDNVTWWLFEKRTQ